MSKWKNYNDKDERLTDSDLINLPLTLADFEGMLETIDNLRREQVKHVGNTKEWFMEHHSYDFTIGAAYVTASEVAGKLSIQFYDLYGEKELDPRVIGCELVEDTKVYPDWFAKEMGYEPGATSTIFRWVKKNKDGSEWILAQAPNSPFGVINLIRKALQKRQLVLHNSEQSEPPADTTAPGKARGNRKWTDEDEMKARQLYDKVNELKQKTTIQTACQRVGISKSTYYNYKRRFE